MRALFAGLFIALLSVLPICADGINIPTAQVAGFRAHKNGTDQTGIADSTFTQVTFSTKAFDNGNYFTSNAWTPPVGLVHLTATVYYSGTIIAGAEHLISIYKNGAALSSVQVDEAAANLTSSMSVTTVDSANGTDAYTVQVFIDVASGTATVNGTSSLTYFAGFVVH